jgi:structural maintenance of chromosome 2
VNGDFGAIFSTLLPGSNAKLRPPDGQTIHDGLVIHVALGDVWKPSLLELSGGQRSLVALSLVLALLLFKPAPLYILDEVDAALDLSHTQNIGTMIRKHFTQSQFVVVSLKEGMFNNANVIFRTKFVDGARAPRAPRPPDAARSHRSRGTPPSCARARLASRPPRAGISTVSRTVLSAFEPSGVERQENVRGKASKKRPAERPALALAN